MSVSVYFGLTESGKSYHVQKHVIPNWSKVIIFDNARCFEGGTIVTDPSDVQIMSLFRRLKNQDKFCLIVRPGGRGKRMALYNKTIELALTLGISLGGRVDPSKRIQLVTDEADSVCNPHFKSEPLHHLVNEGRHENVDSHFIARVPTAIHTDIRRNSTKIVTFRLQNAKEIPLFTDNFGRELASRIRNLDKFHRLEWSDNGETAVFDANNKKVENFLKKFREIPEKFSKKNERGL